jgi:hypothetical protein
MMRERKNDLIKWTEIKKFHDQQNLREKENFNTKEKKRMKLNSSTIDMKLIYEGLANISTLIGNNIKLTKTKEEDNKMMTAYIEELPNIFNQMQQNI